MSGSAEMTWVDSQLRERGIGPLIGIHVSCLLPTSGNGFFWEFFENVPGHHVGLLLYVGVLHHDLSMSTVRYICCAAVVRCPQSSRAEDSVASLAKSCCLTNFWQVDTTWLFVSDCVLKAKKKESDSRHTRRLNNQMWSMIPSMIVSIR